MSLPRGWKLVALPHGARLCDAGSFGRPFHARRSSGSAELTELRQAKLRNEDRKQYHTCEDQDSKQNPNSVAGNECSGKRRVL